MLGKYYYLCRTIRKVNKKCNMKCNNTEIIQRQEKYSTKKKTQNLKNKLCKINEPGWKVCKKKSKQLYCASKEEHNFCFQQIKIVIRIHFIGNSTKKLFFFFYIFDVQ